MQSQKDHTEITFQKKKILFCFTSSYPYGSRETYFENELQYLSQSFDLIYIQPTYNPTGSNVKRSVPENVEVLSIAVPQGITRVFSGILNTSPVMPHFKDFFKERVYKKKANLRSWFNSLLVFRIKYKNIKKKFEKIESETILYSYWGGATIFITKLCRNYKKIIRMHGGDFYLNRNNGYLTLRHDTYKSADLLLPISNDIAGILKKTYKIPEEKIFVNYLGVNNTFNSADFPHAQVKDKILIVSCSNLVALKRVEIIATALATWKSDVFIEWHHFGDGPEMKNIQKIAESFKNEKVKIFFHGWSTTQDIYNFYLTNYVTWLINVSKYEGVPVSIMESFSFGIPAIATNVGATSEIVNASNGHLVKDDISPEVLNQFILSYSDKEYLDKRRNAYITWKEKFNADNNYRQLINKINQL